MLQIVVTHSDNSRGIIYGRNMFIVVAAEESKKIE